MSSPSKNIKTVNKLEEVGKSFIELSQTFKYVTTMENLITMNKNYETSQKVYFHTLASKITSVNPLKTRIMDDLSIFTRAPTVKEEIAVEFGENITLKFFHELNGNISRTVVLLTLPSYETKKFSNLYPRLFHDMKLSSLEDGDRIQIAVKMKDFFGPAKLIEKRVLHKQLKKESIRKIDQDWCSSMFTSGVSTPVLLNVHPNSRKKRKDNKEDEIFKNEVMLLFYNVLFFGSKYGGFANRFYESQKFGVFRNFFLTLHQFEETHDDDEEDMDIPSPLRIGPIRIRRGGGRRNREDRNNDVIVID